jgi:hypothetical protein
MIKLKKIRIYDRVRMILISSRQKEAFLAKAVKRPKVIIINHRANLIICWDLRSEFWVPGEFIIPISSCLVLLANFIVNVDAKEMRKVEKMFILVTINIKCE